MMEGVVITQIHILDYIGSKARMAIELASLIPKSCTVYAEPFAGSAALALNSRDFEEVLINDYNAHIANFWSVALNPETRDVLSEEIQKTEYSKTLFEEAKARKERFGANRTDKIAWAVDTFLLNQQSFNGDSRSWTNRDRERYRSKLKKIPFMFNLLKTQKYRVYNMDAIEFMEQENLLENENAFIFLDPPYLEGLRSDAKLYEVDMPDVRDHIKLLKKIRNSRANIILSGYWSGRDDGTDLYDYYLLPCGWHRHLLGAYTKGCEFGGSSTVGNTVGTAKSQGLEYLWTNYDLMKEAPEAVCRLKSYCDDKKSSKIRKWLEEYEMTER